MIINKPNGSGQYIAPTRDKENATMSVADDLVDVCLQILAADGLLSKHFSHYQQRSGQQKMVTLLAKAISNSEHIVLEAPSGLGKTLAYLIPAMVTGKKTIISTATQRLQNQLYSNDIARLQRALGTQRTIAVLKGRNNYICPYYLHKALDENSRLKNSVRAQLMLLRQRMRESHLGTWPELLADCDSATVRLATCSTQACLGQDCPQISRCPLFLARERAQTADIVIVNHSLLFSNHRLRSERMADILPTADLVVVDEAHKLTETAQTIVGERLSSEQLNRYIQDALAAVATAAPEQRAVQGFLQQFRQAIARLADKLPALGRSHRDDSVTVIDQLDRALCQLEQCFLTMIERSSQFRELQLRARRLQRSLQAIKHSPGLCAVIATTHGFVIEHIPVSLSGLMASMFSDSSANWVFTSATLSVNNSADKFLQFLGLPATCFHTVDSDIDHANNAILYTPRLPVNPDNEAYPQQLCDSAVALLNHIGGRGLFLFASFEMLNATAAELISCCNKPVFVQGTSTNEQLIEQFRCTDDAVLLATGSFWEGLDLSGVPLSAVIIDKLPFANPSDPIVKLRCEELIAHGVDSFQQYLLPDAVIRLRQGCGRLLRRPSDWGVIMIADPRLHSRSYAQAFINSLPPMEHSCCLQPVADFIQTKTTNQLII